MPSGKTHLKIEATMLVVWTACLALLVWIEQISCLQGLLFVGSYIFSMLLMSPDLDLARSDASHRWGIFRWMWLPYAWLFRHRQMSHHLLWGPLTRVAYVGLLALGVDLAVRLGWPDTAFGSRVPVKSVGVICVGLYLPNLQHILADRISTAWRRKRRRHRL